MSLSRRVHSSPEIRVGNPKSLRESKTKLLTLRITTLISRLYCREFFSLTLRSGDTYHADEKRKANGVREFLRSVSWDRDFLLLSSNINTTTTRHQSLAGASCGMTADGDDSFRMTCGILFVSPSWLRCAGSVISRCLVAIESNREKSGDFRGILAVEEKKEQTNQNAGDATLLDAGDRGQVVV